MKSRRFLLLLFLLLPALSFSQTWNWARSIGGPSGDMGIGQVVDHTGNIYTLSTVISTFTVSAVSYTTNGGRDLLVTKHNAGGQLQWLRLIGGSNGENGGGIAVDSAFNVYVTGNFTGTVICGPDTLVAATDEILVTKLDANGQFVWGKKAGSGVSGTESGYAIDYSEADNSIVLTGKIVGTAAFGPFIVGGSGVYLAKLDTAGTWLWANPVGTSMLGLGGCMQIDPAGNIYLLHSGGGMHLRKFTPGGTLTWVTNPTGSVSGSAIKLDGLGNIYVSGTYSGTVTFGAYGLLPPAGAGGFLVKYDTTANALWVQGLSSNSIYAHGIAVTPAGDVLLAGSFNTSFYADTTVFFDMYLGNTDGYVLKFTGNGTLTWFKQVATSQNDILYALNYYGGNVIFTGYVSGTENASFSPINFPNYGGLDAIIGNFNDCAPPYTQVLPSTPFSICEGDSIQLLSSNTSTAYTYQWMVNGAPLPGETGTSLNIASQATYSGGYAIQITSSGCSYMSHYITGIVNPLPVVLFSTINYGTTCNNDSVRISATNLPSHTYQWLFNNTVIAGSTNFRHMAHFTGNYSVIVTSPAGCTDTLSYGLVYIGQYPIVTASNDTTICEGASIVISAGGANTYHWYPSAGISSVFSPSPNAYPSATTTYSVVGTFGSCTDTAYITITVNPSPVPVITNNSNLLSCSGSYSAYQWYYNSNSIFGATASTYPAVLTGNYYVVVTDSLGCTGTSNTLSVIITGGNEISLHENSVLIFPQPLTENATVQLPYAVEEGIFEMYSVSGERVKSVSFRQTDRLIIDRKTLPPGLYLFRISAGDAIFSGKLMVE